MIALTSQALSSPIKVYEDIEALNILKNRLYETVMDTYFEIPYNVIVRVFSFLKEFRHIDIHLYYAAVVGRRQYDLESIWFSKDIRSRYGNRVDSYKICDLTYTSFMNDLKEFTEVLCCGILDSPPFNTISELEMKYKLMGFDCRNTEIWKQTLGKIYG